MRNIINFLLLVSLFSCGGGTSTGNPLRITVQSAAYGNSSSLRSAQKSSTHHAEIKSEDLDFRICVSDVIFENSADERITVAFDDIGLVDLSDPTSTITWGKIFIEEGKGFSFDTIIIVADNELCGKDFSLSYKGNEIGEPFELIFEYTSQSFNTQDGDIYRLDLDSIVAAADDALINGEFNDSEWAGYIDDFVEDFEEDDDFFDDEGQFGD